MKTQSFLLSAVSALALALSAGCQKEVHDGHDEKKTHEGHAGEEIAVTLNDSAVRLAGIVVSRAQTGVLDISVDLPGEISVNQEKEVHVTPRYPGIIREAGKMVGQAVSRGEALAVIESNENLTAYTIAAPMAGRIIAKHAAIGEFAGEGHDLYVLADLSTVWVNCEAFAGDLPGIRPGASILVSAVGSPDTVRAIVSYVAPIISAETRTAVVRAVIPGGGVWRPGLFVKGTIRFTGQDSALCVEKAAVQVLSGREMVFVPGSDAKNEFEAVPVKTGRSDRARVEVIEGLKAGDSYVSSGAFEIKSQIVTGALGGHAGHGH